jgi:pilus assembly protein CpaC
MDTPHNNTVHLTPLSRREQIARRTQEIVAERRGEATPVDPTPVAPTAGRRHHPALFAAATAALTAVGVWTYLEHGTHGPAPADAAPVMPDHVVDATPVEEVAPVQAAITPQQQVFASLPLLQTEQMQPVQELPAVTFNVEPLPELPSLEELDAEIAALAEEPQPAEFIAPTTQPARIVNIITPPVPEVDTSVAATDALVINGLDENGDVARLVTAGTQVITTARPLSRVSVGSEGVARVNMIGDDSLLLTAAGVGTTQLIVWDDAGEQQLIQVIVEPDLASVRETLNSAFPDAGIEVIPLNKSIGLKGRVRNTDVAEQAAALAGTFGPVVNLLEISGAQQVQLKVRFAEVSREVSKQLGFNYGTFDGTSSAAVTIGQVGQLTPLVDSTTDLILPGALGLGGTSTAGLSFFGGGSIGGSEFEYFISALSEANLLRMLAEPTATVISGEQGSILAGGRVPYPVPSEDGIAIQFQEFGIRLNYEPMVMGDGRIRLKLATRASELDFAAGVAVAGTVVPALREKENITTVEMASGQSFVIGGLLSQNVVSSKSKIPVLGDLPILGALFRSTRFERRETELVVMVTPHLVEPMNPAQTSALPGEDWRFPKSSELFLEGDLGGDRNYEYVPPVEPADDDGIMVEPVAIREEQAQPVIEEAAPAVTVEPMIPEMEPVKLETKPVKDEPIEVKSVEIRETVTAPTVAPEAKPVEVIVETADAPRRETYQPQDIKMVRTEAEPMVLVAPELAEQPEPAPVPQQPLPPTGPAFIGSFDFNQVRRQNGNNDPAMPSDPFKIKPLD